MQQKTPRAIWHRAFFLYFRRIRSMFPAGQFKDTAVPETVTMSIPLSLPSTS